MAEQAAVVAFGGQQDALAGAALEMQLADPGIVAQRRRVIVPAAVASRRSATSRSPASGIGGEPPAAKSSAKPRTSSPELARISAGKQSPAGRGASSSITISPSRTTISTTQIARTMPSAAAAAASCAHRPSSAMPSGSGGAIT